MSKSTPRVDYLGSAGLVQSISDGGWDFIYRASTVRDPKWNLGDRVVLPDGREFRYAKSGTVCPNGYAVHFTDTGHQAYTALGVSTAVGDKTMTIPAGTHDEVTENELVGGTVLIFQGGSDDNTTTRLIVGNAASGAADVAYTITLDAAVTYAYVAGTAAIEVYANPYATLSYNVGSAIAGLPVRYIGASSTYFWVQTKGLCWVVAGPGVGVDSGTGNRQYGAFWAANGITVRADVALDTTVPSANSSQYAGYTVAGSQEGNGPLFMLQG